MKKEKTCQFESCLVEYYYAEDSHNNSYNIARVIDADDNIHVYLEDEIPCFIDSPIKYMQGRLEDMGFIGEASTETDTVVFLYNLKKYIRDPETTPENREKFISLLDDLDCYYWKKEEVLTHFNSIATKLIYIGDNKYVRNDKGYTLDFGDKDIEDTPIEFISL